jgi:hypothetical protein
MTLPTRDFDVATINQVVDTLGKAGLSTHDKLVIAGQWLSAQGGDGRRVFSYSTPLAATEAACGPDFVRGFAHVDWIDGESVVQAEETSVEDGFNKRFHAIESDLDALGRDAAKSFQCLAELRASLQALLEEVRTELNRLNADVYDCCKRHGPPDHLTFPVPVRPGLLTATAFLGKVDMLGKPMQLWQTEAGTVLLPNQPAASIGDPWNDTRVIRSAELARTVAENAEIDKLFGGEQAVTKEALVAKAGDIISPNGMRVKDLVAILPEGTRFTSSADLVREVGEREAAALRTSGTADAALANAFGLGTDVDALSAAPLDRLGAIPIAARTAFVAAGITTLGDFAAKQPKELAAILKKARVPSSAGDIPAWLSTAGTLLKTK